MPLPKSKNNFSLFSQIIFGIILLLIFLLGLSLLKHRQEQQNINQNIAQLKKQINQLEKNNKRLEYLISYFQSDNYVEKEARTKLEMKKPGEKVIVVLNNNKKSQAVATSSVATATSSAPKVSLPKKWWLYFFGPKK